MAATVSVAVHTERRALRDPLSLWHLLSLDAPTVAALWTAFTAASFHVALPRTAILALALAVWLLYAADRLSDGRQQRYPLEERHRFHARHASAFVMAMCFSAPVLAALLLWIPAPLRWAWMLLALPLLGYAAAVHVLRMPVPKELMVGMFFAAAVAMPCLLHEPSLPLLLCALLFGTLCWLNCALIARWEQVPLRDIDWLTAAAVHRFRTADSVLATVAASTAVAMPAARCMALTVAFAALLMLLLDTMQARMGAVRVRALADAALLTPLLFWPLLTHLR